MTDDKERAGLGKVVYSVNASDEAETSEAKREEREDVEEADVESFPASDPPSFSGGSSTESQ